MFLSKLDAGKMFRIKSRITENATELWKKFKTVKAVEIFFCTLNFLYISSAKQIGDVFNTFVEIEIFFSMLTPIKICYIVSGKVLLTKCF